MLYYYVSFNALQLGGVLLFLRGPQRMFRSIQVAGVCWQPIRLAAALSGAPTAAVATIQLACGAAPAAGRAIRRPARRAGAI